MAGLIFAEGTEATRRPDNTTSTAEGGKVSLREKAVSVVADHPGASILRVAKALGCTHPTAAYHLNALVKEKRITREHEGRIARHFAVDQDSAVIMHLRAHLRDPRRRRIARFLLTEIAPQLSINRMANRLEVTFGYLKRTLTIFADHGLVQMEKRTHQFAVRATDSLRTGMSLIGEEPPGKATRD